MERPEPVAILCGGRGTRLQEKTHAIPKPLVEIGGRPIVWHVIRIYAAHGFRRFLLMTGYKGEMIERFAADEQWPDGVEVECLPTGEETPTGGRVARAADRLGGGTFALTYADGVADVDLGAALEAYDAWIVEELETSKEILEAKFKVPVTSFAYPWGRPWDFDEASQRAVRIAGFSAACTMTPGVNLPRSDPMQYTRLAIDDNCELHLLVAEACGGFELLRRFGLDLS